MPSPGSSSCSLCNRPLAIDSTGGLCEECLRQTVSVEATPVSCSGTLSAPPDHSPTQSHALPRLMPAEHPYAVQFQSTHVDTKGTQTPRPDGETADADFKPPATLPEPPPGYEFLRVLGRGGMGSVYLARELATQRAVAMKLLNAPGHGNIFDRFQVEILALANLKHPNIISVLEAKTHGREPYFTMEFAEGGTLADRARRSPPIAPAEAARLMLNVGEAVAAAHAAGILHRDLKPSNILLRRQETAEKSAVDLSAFVPLVSDFGLAKRTDRDEALTRTGALGTPSYMSPEAAAGRFRDISAASDVYGLGATLYHLLTGRPPFTGGSDVDVMNKVVAEPVARPRSVRPEVPEELEAIAMKAMEKSPSARYASASDFADDLKRYLAGETPRAPVLSRRRRTRQWLVRNRARLSVAVGAVLFAVGLVAMSWLAFKPETIAAVPTEDDWLAEVTENLKAGRTVNLVGEKGLPKYHRTLLESNGLGTSVPSDGACEFHAFDVCLLELLRDPGIDRYRVTFEVRQLPSKDTENSVDYVGVYFGYGSGGASDGTQSHGMFAVTWKDRDRKADPKNPGVHAVYVERLGFLQHPNRLARSDPAKPASFKFRPPDRLPGEWRQVALEVTPKSVRIEWPAALGKTSLDWPDDKPSVQYRMLKKSLDERILGSGASLPEWSPRMPFGVIAQRASVAVRNVSIIPLQSP